MGCDTPGCSICYPDRYNDYTYGKVTVNYDDFVGAKQVIAVGNTVDRYYRSDLKKLGTGTTLVRTDDPSIVVVKTGPDNWVSSSSARTTEELFAGNVNGSYVYYKVLHVVQQEKEPLDKVAESLWFKRYPEKVGQNPFNGNTDSRQGYKNMAKWVLDNYTANQNGGEPTFVIDRDGDRWERQSSGRYKMRLDQGRGKIESGEGLTLRDIERIHLVKERGFETRVKV